MKRVCSVPGPASVAMTLDRHGHLPGDELGAGADGMDAARADRMRIELLHRPSGVRAEHLMVR
jgi:hypothetical protein